MQAVFLERLMGVEPTYAAWEAAVLPMNYIRIWNSFENAPYFLMNKTIIAPVEEKINLFSPTGAIFIVGVTMMCDKQKKE